MNALRTNRLMVAVLWASTLFTVAILVFIIGYILYNGLPVITWEFLSQSPQRMGREGGILPAIIGTLLLTTIAIIIAAPIGVGTAIYLTEYTRDGWIPRLVRFGTESLAGIPSIIYGLFGFIFFVIYLEMGWSILAGGLTLASMILPTIERTAEEALKAVPNSYREVSYSLGASRWQTVTGAVLPTAMPGIVTGIVLSIGRSVGETAAVIFTAGTALRIPQSLTDSVRTLPVHFYLLAREGISLEKAFGTAAVLVIAVLAINSIAYWLLVKVVVKRT